MRLTTKVLLTVAYAEYFWGGERHSSSFWGDKEPILKNFKMESYGTTKNLGRGHDPLAPLLPTQLLALSSFSRGGEGHLGIQNSDSFLRLIVAREGESSVFEQALVKIEFSLSSVNRANP